MGGVMSCTELALCSEEMMNEEIKRRQIPTVEKLPLPQLVVGEGPHWSANTQSLYLVDTATATIYRYNAATNRYYSAKIDVPCIGFITPVSGTENLFVIGAHTTLYLVRWNGFSPEIESMEALHKLPMEPESNRINDGKCDRNGRLWFGTMKLDDFLNGKVASFYSFTKESGLERHLSEVGISNGLTWNYGKGLMYYIDTQHQSVEGFDYNQTEGMIWNRRVVFDFKEHGFPFYPDGMTIDIDGNLWVACYGGARVIKIDPDSNSFLDKIDIPTANVTSLTWGGNDFSDLYVTTNNLDNDGKDPNGGCTFRVSGLNTRGLPMGDFKLI